MFVTKNRATLHGKTECNFKLTKEQLKVPNDKPVEKIRILKSEYEMIDTDIKETFSFDESSINDIFKGLFGDVSDTRGKALSLSRSTNHFRRMT
jgi:hypothetical protein